MLEGQLGLADLAADYDLPCRPLVLANLMLFWLTALWLPCGSLSLQLSSLRFSWNSFWTTFRTSRSEGFLSMSHPVCSNSLVVFSLE